jgi:hypothetical protein
MDMPKRTTPLVTGEYYHIYNRGVAYLPTYKRKNDYERFIQCLTYYRHANIPCKLSRLHQLPKETQKEIIATLKNGQNYCISIIGENRGQPINREENVH